MSLVPLEATAPVWLAARGLALLLVVAYLMAVGASEARGQDPNRLTNPGAESGDTADWDAAAFRAARYGESAIEHEDGFGGWLFEATDARASMRQVISLADLAVAIDAGRQDLTVGGSLGGPAGSPDGMRISAQPLDGAGVQLGPPVVAGPPTAADRGHRSAFVYCFQDFQPPVGTRALEVALAPANVAGATTAAADVLYAGVIRGRPAALGPTIAIPGEGPGCWRYVPWQMPMPQPTVPQLRAPDCANAPPATPQANAPQPPPPGTVAASPAPPPPIPVCVSSPGSPSDPGVPVSTAALRVSHLVLTRTRLSLRVSSPATVGVRLARRVRAPAANWRRVTGLTLHAPTAGKVTQKLPRLRPGRYRISIRGNSSEAGTAKRIVTRVIKR